MTHGKVPSRYEVALTNVAASPDGLRVLAPLIRPLFEPDHADPLMAGRRNVAVELWRSVVTLSPASIGPLLAAIGEQDDHRNRPGDYDPLEQRHDGPEDDGDGAAR